MNKMKKKPIPPIGAHLRISASRLMFRAALRYLADSDRRDVESCDIPARSCQGTLWPDMAGMTHDQDYLLSKASPPYS